MEAETMTFPSLKIKELVLCSAELGWVIVDPRMFLVSDLLSVSMEEIFNFARSWLSCRDWLGGYMSM